MSNGVQLLIVVVLVMAATVFATWRLLSGALRLRAIEAALRVLPQGSALTVWLNRLASRQRAATGCDACERNPEHRG